MTDVIEEVESSARASTAARLIGRITRVEWILAALTVFVLAGLVVAEPDVLGAPLENGRTLLFTIGGSVLGAIALIVMLQLRVPSVARIAVLGVPLVVVSWWLISPFFVDDVVNDDFSTSIVAAGSDPTATDEAADAVPTIPALRGSGRFVGLAGHRGTGSAGFFAVDDGAVVLRLEDLDIQNGPDLRLYVVAGTDQSAPSSDSLNLGKLRGNVGNQTYDLPAGFALERGAWTVLVWCEAFDVEFAAAAVTVT